MKKRRIFYKVEDYQLTGEKTNNGSFTIAKKDSKFYFIKFFKGIQNEEQIKAKYIYIIKILQKLNHPAIIKYYGINVNFNEIKIK